MSYTLLGRTKIDGFLKATVLVILIMASSLVHGETEEKYNLPKFTELVLPSGSSAEWVIPPIPTKAGKKRRLSPRHFGIDGEGLPWFGYNGEALLNLWEQTLVIVDQPYEDFTWLDNGKFLMCANGFLGDLVEKPENARETKSPFPIMQFNPFLKLSHKKFRVFSARNNVIYLVGYNPHEKKNELYLLIEERERNSDAKKILATKKKITAVAGDENRIYITMKRMIYKLSTDGKNIEAIFRHPREEITALEFSQESGLFYTTKSAIGFIGVESEFEFLESPDTKIRLRDESLYVLLGETCGIIRIDGINKFKNLKVGSSERQTQPLQTQTWKQLSDINSALIQAARVGDTAKVKQLLKQGADVNAKGEYDETALHRAASMGHTDTVKVLIDAGAGVNARDESSWTALMWTSAYIDIAKALIDAGAEVKVEGGDTAMAVAAQNDHMDNIMRLLKQAAAKGQTVSEEAKRHMVRGQAAVGIARTWQDYEIAIEEFEQAAKFAPDWPEIYYNLGVVQEKAGQYGEAIGNLKKYLELAPDASNTEQVQELVYKVEKAKRELLDPNSLVGIWWPDLPGWDDSSVCWRFEIRNNNGKVEARALTRQLYESDLPKGEFVPIQWDGKILKISRAVYYTCTSSVDPNWCPCEATYNLTRVSVNKLEGEIEVSGVYGFKGAKHFKSKYTRAWIRRK